MHTTLQGRVPCCRRPCAGGGEDVDFCLLLGARLRAVPGAAVEHPWWEEGRPQARPSIWGCMAYAGLH